ACSRGRHRASLLARTRGRRVSPVARSRIRRGCRARRSRCRCVRSVRRDCRRRRAYHWIGGARSRSFPGNSKRRRCVMRHWLSQPWPWYVAGPLIGLCVPALLLIGNKPLGSTTSLRAMCAGLFPSRVEFFNYDWKRSGSWNIALVGGIAVGAFIAATLLPHDTSALLPATLFSWNALLTTRGAIGIVLG